MTTDNAPVTVAEIEAWICTELATRRGTTLDEIQAEIAGDVPIDSLEGVEIAIAAETSFGVRIEDRELPAVSGSIHKLAGLIAAKVAVRAGAADAQRGAAHARV